MFDRVVNSTHQHKECYKAMNDSYKFLRDNYSDRWVFGEFKRGKTAEESIYEH